MVMNIFEKSQVFSGFAAFKRDKDEAAGVIRQRRLMPADAIVLACMPAVGHVDCLNNGGAASLHVICEEIRPNLLINI
jgi:hypothetical protein